LPFFIWFAEAGANPSPPRQSSLRCGTRGRRTCPGPYQNGPFFVGFPRSLAYNENIMLILLAILIFIAAVWLFISAYRDENRSALPAETKPPTDSTSSSPSNIPASESDSSTSSDCKASSAISLPLGIKIIGGYFIVMTVARLMPPIFVYPFFLISMSLRLYFSQLWPTFPFHGISHILILLCACYLLKLRDWARRAVRILALVMVLWNLVLFGIEWMASCGLAFNGIFLRPFSSSLISLPGMMTNIFVIYYLNRRDIKEKFVQ